MSRREKLLLLFLALVVLAALLSIPARRMFTLITLRGAIAPQGRLFVTFHPHAWLDQKLIDSALKFSGHSGIPNTSRPLYECLIGNSVSAVVLSEVEPTGRMAELAMEFPRLKSASIMEKHDGAHAPEVEWATVIHTVSTVRGLEHLSLYGREITDAALAPLAAHPNLRSIVLNSDRLTPACLTTIATFPQLRALYLEHLVHATEADWTGFCTGIRKMPGLVQILIAGDHLVDGTIAPLAGHPGIVEVRILDHNLTPACAATFAALPRLTHVYFGTRTPAFTPEEKKAITDALPGKRVIFNSDRGRRFK
jgi:hypothetical protein